MKNKIIIYAMVMTVLMLVGCKASGEINAEKVTIEFYNATSVEDFSSEFGEYVLDDKPMFTVDDIEYYDWDNQIIMFKSTSEVACESFDSFDHNNLTLSSFATKSMDKYFVYVDKEFIYSGYYGQSPLSSFLPVGNTLIDIDNGVKLGYLKIDDTEGKDKRFDEKLYDALSANGILKE